MYIVNIYGTAKSISPDIQYAFNIASTFSNVKWIYEANNISFEFKNELISELTEEQVINKITSTVNEIINSESAKNWLIMPKLRLYYDDEINGPVINIG